MTLISRNFSPGAPCNIGVAPKNGLVLIDLDSKSDNGVSVRRFLDDHSELDQVPQHRSSAGGHLVATCPNLPQLARPNGSHITRFWSEKSMRRSLRSFIITNATTSFYRPQFIRPASNMIGTGLAKSRLGNGKRSRPLPF